MGISTARESHDGGFSERLASSKVARLGEIKHKFAYFEGVYHSLREDNRGGKIEGRQGYILTVNGDEVCAFALCTPGANADGWMDLDRFRDKNGSGLDEAWLRRFLAGCKI